MRPSFNAHPTHGLAGLPLALLRPESCPDSLVSLEQKLRLLADAGVDRAIIDARASAITTTAQSLEAVEG